MLLFDIDELGNTLVVDPHDGNQIDVLGADCGTQRLSGLDDYLGRDPCESGPSVLMHFRQVPGAKKLSTRNVSTLNSAQSIAPLLKSLRELGAVSVVSSANDETTVALNSSRGIDADRLRLLIDSANKDAKNTEIDIHTDIDGPSFIEDPPPTAENTSQDDNHLFLSAIGTAAVDEWKAVPTTVAVIDGGIFPHNDLRDHLDCCTIGSASSSCQGWMARGGATTCIDGKFQHATMVAGMIGAVSKETGARFGVAPRARIQSWQGGTKDPAKPCKRPLAIAAAIRAAAAQGAQVLNVSLQRKSTCPTIIVQALDYARSLPSDPVVVISAGNTDISLDSPNAHFCPAQLRRPGMVTVMAVDLDGAKASSYGPKHIPLAVPVGEGENICSTSYNMGLSRGGCPPSYSRMGESSMAAAAMSGAVALVRSHPNYSRCSAAQVVAILRCKAKPVSALEGLVGQPGGMLDLHFLGAPYPDGEAPQDFCAGWSHQADNVDMTSKICDSIPKPKAPPPSPVANH